MKLTIAYLDETGHSTAHETAFETTADLHDRMEKVRKSIAAAALVLVYGKGYEGYWVPAHRVLSVEVER